MFWDQVLARIIYYSNHLGSNSVNALYSIRPHSIRLVGKGNINIVIQVASHAKHNLIINNI